MFKSKWNNQELDPRTDLLLQQPQDELDIAQPIEPSDSGISQPTIRNVGEVQPAVTEKITIEELIERERASGGPQDRDSVLDALDGTLEDLHRNGSELHANCPSCGHTRNPNAKGKSDRFFSTIRTNYQFWTCRHCDYKTTTNQLLGHAPGQTTVQRPIVKSWDQQDHSPQKIEWTRAAYASLTEYAQRHLALGMEYLEGRGVSPEVAKEMGLGYIDRRHYLGWYRGLTPELKAGCEFGGLPEVKENGQLGSGWAMVSGYRGKIVFPYRDHNGDVCDIRTRSISDSDTANGKPIRYMGPRGGYEERQAQLPYMPTGNHSMILLTEGEFKSLVPLSNGCIYPVYSLRGTSEPITPMVQYFQNKTVILAFDNDDAGKMATVRQGRALKAKGISVLILDPAQLTSHKAIDDFINAEEIEVFNKLLEPSNLLTLPEFEATFDNEVIEKLEQPKADVGTVRRWTPSDQIDTFAHLTASDTISPDEATDQLKGKFKEFLKGWRNGNGQLFTDAPAGVGKTTTALEAAREIIETENGTISIFLPNHTQIDEKINDGTLEGFQHIYGRRWDKQEDGIKNCIQADTASTLTELGYDVASMICPNCPQLNWCQAEGYKSQFKGRANRAYVHNHIFTDYPASSDIAIIDEAGHKIFIKDTQIYGGHLQRALAEGVDNQAQKELLESLRMLFEIPDIETLTGIEFYAVLQRHYPELIETIDEWGDGLAVQGALNGMVLNYTQSGDRNIYEVEHLPPAFAHALFGVLNEDVKRIAAGQQPTGRIKLINAGTYRYIEIVSSKRLPDWYYKTPTILLNATANETVINELFGIEGQLAVISPNVTMMDGNEIVQDITVNNAKSGLLGNGDTATRQRAIWLERIRDHIGPHDQTDVVLITVKPLASYLADTFPNARVAWYGALEGRNDLQAGLTILCNPPAINLPAIQDEARALWPGIDTSLTRKSTAFDIQNEIEQYLTVEQIDAVDPRLSALIDQHRDALAIQAIGRARLIRNSGRRVVVMFSRPIPHVTPTQVIYTRAQRGEYKANKTLERLIQVAGELLEGHNNFSPSSLAEAAQAARRTVIKYWQAIIDAVGIQWVELPFLQPMKNGGQRSVKVRIAANNLGLQMLKEYIQESKDHCMIHSLLDNIIGNGSYSDLAIPEGFRLDIKIMYPNLVPAPPEAEPDPVPIPTQPAFHRKITTPDDEILYIAPGVGIISSVPVIEVTPIAQAKPSVLVRQLNQIARTTLDSPDQAQSFAQMIIRGGLYEVTVNNCIVDMAHRSGFDISHLASDRTEIIELEAVL